MGRRNCHTALFISYSAPLNIATLLKKLGSWSVSVTLSLDVIFPPQPRVTKPWFLLSFQNMPILTPKSDMNEALEEEKKDLLDDEYRPNVVRRTRSWLNYLLASLLFMSICINSVFYFRLGRYATSCTHQEPLSGYGNLISPWLHCVFLLIIFISSQAEARNFPAISC